MSTEDRVMTVWCHDTYEHALSNGVGRRNVALLAWNWRGPASRISATGTETPV